VALRKNAQGAASSLDAAPLSGGFRSHVDPAFPADVEILQHPRIPAILLYTKVYDTRACHGVDFLIRQAADIAGLFRGRIHLLSH